MLRHLFGSKTRLAAIVAGITIAGSAQAATGRADDTVAVHLGGFPGIYAFLRERAAPALLSDPMVGPFFSRLTETPDDIEQCLAMLLDHDLGGSSPHNGAVLADGHECRSSMSNIHRGLAIPDPIVTRFIVIVAQQATAAGIAPADIQAVGKVLERYRGGTRNK